MDAELTWELLTGNYELGRVSKPIGAFRMQEDAKTFQNVDKAQQAELDKIYDHPWYEDIVPSVILKRAAQATKLILLITNGRYDALRYNIEHRL
jgi:hypothetical protein